MRERPTRSARGRSRVSAYEDLIRQGKILYWGVSEWRASQIIDACRSAELRNAYRPVSNQPQYNLLRRGIEKEVLPVCQREGVGQVVFSPLAQGVLTGKYGSGDPPADSRAADEFRNQFMHDFLRPESLAKVDALRPLAQELGISLAQLALAWCLRQSNVSSLIVGATKVAQLEDTAKASGMRLPPEIAARIDEITRPPAP